MAHQSSVTGPGVGVGSTTGTGIIPATGWSWDASLSAYVPSHTGTAIVPPVYILNPITGNMVFDASLVPPSTISTTNQQIYNNTTTTITATTTATTNNYLTSANVGTPSLYSGFLALPLGEYNVAAGSPVGTDGIGSSFQWGNKQSGTATVQPPDPAAWEGTHQGAGYISYGDPGIHRNVGIGSAHTSNPIGNLQCPVLTNTVDTAASDTNPPMDPGMATVYAILGDLGNGNVSPNV